MTMLSMQKRYAVVVTTDRSACRYARWGQWQYVLNSTLGGECEMLVISEPLMDEYTLYHAACVVVERPTTEEHFRWVSRYASLKKKYRFRLLIDYDDILWSIGGKSPFPAWNGCTTDHALVHRLLGENLGKVDGVLCSTQYLAFALCMGFGMEEGPSGTLDEDSVCVVPNYGFPQLFHGMNHRTRGESARLKVAYCGGTTHMAASDLGDFDGPWLPALEKSSKFVEFHAFGEKNGLLPDNTIYHPYKHASEWPAYLSEMRPDVCIAPLSPHPFNAAKSAIKFIEGTLVGAVNVCSTWKGSPYVPFIRDSEGFGVDGNTTEDELVDILDSLRSVPLRRKIVDRQRQLLSRMNLIAGESGGTDYFLKTLFGDFLIKGE